MPAARTHLSSPRMFSSLMLTGAQQECVVQPTQCSKLRHYSISSSARADRFPSALAVSSNSVDCITGRSPLRRPDVVSNRIADERIDEPTMPGAHQPARIDMLTCSERAPCDCKADEGEFTLAL
jgi:hypothetical protein